MKILHQNGPYRFIEKGIIAHNGKPDYRLQKQNEHNNYWYDKALLDNAVQCSYAMEDLEYAKLLCGDPCYGQNVYQDE